VAALDTIKKGAAVHLKGRLRCNKYTDAQGNERSFVEVLAFELQVLDESAEEGNQQ
jgi:single-stranded DNA-binding protein